MVASLPVMPWTMTLLSLLMKIDIALCVLSCPGEVGQLCRFVSGLVHGVHQRHQRVIGFGEDSPALLDVVAVEPDHQRLGRGIAEDLQRLNDSAGHRVARGDAAEYVDEHTLDLLVAQDDV